MGDGLTRQPRDPSFLDALIPLVALTVLIGGSLTLSPGWYYAATAIICGVVALSIGSSRTTAATIGVGRALRLHRFRIEKIEPSDTSEELS